MWTLLILLVLALVALFMVPILIACALEAAPMVIGVLVCLWLLHAMGCV